MFRPRLENPRRVLVQIPFGGDVGLGQDQMDDVLGDDERQMIAVRQG